MKTFEITILANIFIAAFAPAQSIANTWEEHGPLEVSANKRYLQHKDGTPFLWLGGTAWSMYIHANREDVIDYLDNRKAKGFTSALGWQGCGFGHVRPKDRAGA